MNTYCLCSTVRRYSTRNNIVNRSRHSSPSDRTTNYVYTKNSLHCSKKIRILATTSWPDSAVSRGVCVCVCVSVSSDTNFWTILYYQNRKWRLYVTRAGHLPPLHTHVPRESPPRTSACHTCPNTNRGVVSAIIVFGGGRQVSGGQMSDHTWSWHTRVRR